MIEKVAGNQYLFGRQIHEQHRVGVAPPETFDELYFAIAEIDVELTVVERE
jgi:hypothetical protein